MSYLWSEHQEDVDWVVLLVDIRNAFNEINRTVMLYHVWNTWTAGAKFIFNTYPHWKVLVLQMSEL